MRPRWETSFPEPHGDAEDDPGQVGRGPTGLAYVCETCGWTGKGAMAYDHHREHHTHSILLRDMSHLGPVAWGCCHELSSHYTVKDMNAIEQRDGAATQPDLLTKETR